MTTIREVPREMTIPEMVFLLHEKGYVVTPKADIIKFSFARIKDKNWPVEDFKEHALPEILKQIKSKNIELTERTLEGEINVTIQQAVLRLLKPEMR